MGILAAEGYACVTASGQELGKGGFADSVWRCGRAFFIQQRHGQRQAGPGKNETKKLPAQVIAGEESAEGASVRFRRYLKRLLRISGDLLRQSMHVSTGQVLQSLDSFPRNQSRRRGYLACLNVHVDEGLDDGNVLKGLEYP